MRSKFLFLVLLLSVSCVPQLWYYRVNQGDKNNNGVRDDIEAYINSYYDNKNLKNALFQFSNAFWRVTQPGLNKDEFLKGELYYLKSYNCLWLISEGLGKKESVYSVESALTNRHLNTLDNWKRYKEYLRNVGRFDAGTVFNKARLTTTFENPSAHCLFEITAQDKEKYLINIKKNWPGMI